MNKNQFIDLYSRHGWPIVRNFVSKSNRCSNCIVSEKYTPLKSGLCQACIDFKKNKVFHSDPEPVHSPRNADFERVVNSYVTDDKYDAVLMLSGGKDSAYILHRLRTEFPRLKILCVLVNNGFMSPLAIPGAKRVAEKLKTDLVIVNSHVDDFAKAIRAAFLALNGRGGYGVVDFADGELIFDIGKKITRDLKVPLLIGGLSWVQVQMIVEMDGYMRTLPDGTVEMFPLAFWRTDEQEVRAKVRELELLPPGSDSPVQSNSDLILAMSVVDIMNLGYCSFEPEFAQLVREGKTDRKVWLHLFEMLEYAALRGFFKNDLSKILGRLDLSIADVVKK